MRMESRTCATLTYPSAAAASCTTPTATVRPRPTRATRAVARRGTSTITRTGSFAWRACADGTVARAIEYAFLATERLEEAQRERIWAIVEAHQSGLSVRQIAGDIGLSSSRVHQLLGSDEAREIPRWLSQQRRRNRPDRPPQEAARSPHEAPEARGTARKGLVELDQQLARMPREVVLTGGGLTITEVLAVAHRSQRDHPHRMAGRRPPPPGKVARRSQARSASPLSPPGRPGRREIRPPSCFGIAPDRN